MDAREIVALRSVCRESYQDFVKEFWCEVPGAGTLIWNWHLGFICDELQIIAERVFRNQPKEYDLIDNQPPGTSKSTIFSILFMGWTWTRMPHARHINASHTDTLVLDLANKARDVITSDKYRKCFPWIELKADQDTKGYYANTMGGSRLSCTVGGKTPTGFHAHFLGQDDPIDPQKALSVAELKTANHFATNVLPTRKVNKDVSVMFTVMQRLHKDDPTGTMLEMAKKEGKTPIRHICLPAEDTGKISPLELRSFYVDGLLDPVRLSRSVLRDYRSTSAYAYAGQFMQTPIVLEGGMFEATYFNLRCKAAPHKAKRIRYWDRACLVAGTGIVVTGELNGYKNIEDVVAGDIVLTRGTREDHNVSKKVLWAGMTGYASGVVSVRFVDGSIVSGTPDHKVWTDNRSWVELGSLVKGDRVIACGNKANYDPDVDQHPWTTVDFKIFRRFDPPLPVYDLEVEDAHEFFANGILVHNSTADGGCYTAGVLMARDADGSYFVEHVVHGQWEPKKRNEVMLATARRDRTRYAPGSEPIIAVEREGGSAGRDAWLGIVKALEGFSVIEDTVTGSKDSRAEPWSVQLAAGNVWIVEDGTWDINGYIEEHCSFQPEVGVKRFGKYKDQVDASAAAFRKLMTMPSGNTGFRVLSPGKQKAGQIRIVVCSREELANTLMDDKCILIVVNDPEHVGRRNALIELMGEEVMCNGTSESNRPERDVSVTQGGGMQSPPLPPHGITKLLDSVQVAFADVAPEEHQETWGEIVEAYGVPADKVMMLPEHGKRIWATLLKKRDEQARAWVLCGEGRIPCSLAQAICETLRLDKKTTVFSVEGESVCDNEVNPHVVAVTKRTRHMVM